MLINWVNICSEPDKGIDPSLSFASSYLCRLVPKFVLLQIFVGPEGGNGTQRQELMELPLEGKAPEC